jgi:hypothetical protein
VTGEEPEARRNGELGDRAALAKLTAIKGQLSYPIHHQHRRRRQLGIARTEVTPLA